MEAETKVRSRKRGSRKKQHTNAHLPGIVLFVLFLAMEAWFFVRLVTTKLLPAKYLWLIAAVLVILAGVIGFLVWNVKKKVPFWIGAALAVLFSAAFVIGGGAVGKVHGTIRSWEQTTESVRTVHMGVYVLADDAARALEDIVSEPIGIMSQVDREEAEKVLTNISSELQVSLKVRTYNSFIEEVLALQRGEVRSIILDQDYIDVIVQIPGYEDITQRIRSLDTYRVDVPAFTTTEVVPSGAAETTAAEEPSGTENESDSAHHTKAPHSWEILNPEDETTTAEPTETAKDPTEPSRSDDPAPQPPAPTAAPPAPTTPAPPTTAASITVPAGQEGRIFTLYISGLDNRGGGLASRGNSDVNILAVVNMNSKQLLLINTPRDFYVPFPLAGGTRDKLTHGGYYGVQASMDILKGLYGVTSDYYFRVGFSGFQQLVNTLGGVSVYSAYDFDTGTVTKTIETLIPATNEAGETDESAESVVSTETVTEAKYHFHSGYNDVDGAAALAFVRERHAFEAGDRVRGQNQMELIKAVLRKATSTSALANYSAILDSVSGLVQTSMPYDVMSSMVQSFLNGDSWNIVSYAVSGSNGNEYCFSIGMNNYVMWPNYSMVSYAQSLIRQVYNGSWVSP